MQKNPEYNIGDIYPNDRETKFNRPGIKLVLNALTAFLLGTHFDALTDAYFSSVAIFVIPMLFEYFSFMPNDKVRHVLYIVERGILLLICFVCFFGFCGIMHITSGKNMVTEITVASDYALFPGKTFPALFLLGSILLSFALSVTDFFAQKSKFDLKFNNYPTTAATH